MGLLNAILAAIVDAFVTVIIRYLYSRVKKLWSRDNVERLEPITVLEKKSAGLQMIAAPHKTSLGSHSENTMSSYRTTVSADYGSIISTGSGGYADVVKKMQSVEQNEDSEFRKKILLLTNE